MSKNASRVFCENTFEISRRTVTAYVSARRFTRAQVAATALIKNSNGFAWYLVRNLSAGGALLTDGSILNKGARVNVVLQIAGCIPWATDAIVVRNELTTVGVGQALMFCDGTPELQRIIESEVQAAIDRSRGPRVLVASRNVKSLGEIAAKLTSLGRRVILTTDGADAMSWLRNSDSETPIDSILADDSNHELDAVQLLVSAQEQFPAVRCVLLCDDSSRASRLAVVHHAVAKPWPCCALRVALAP